MIEFLTTETQQMYEIPYGLQFNGIKLLQNVGCGITLLSIIWSSIYTP